MLAGYLADRYDSRLVYLVALSTKPVLLVVSILLAGLAGLVAAAVLVLVIDIASPSESLARAVGAGEPAWFRLRRALRGRPCGNARRPVACRCVPRDSVGGLLVGLAALTAFGTIAAAAIPGDVASSSDPPPTFSAETGANERAGAARSFILPAHRVFEIACSASGPAPLHSYNILK